MTYPAINMISALLLNVLDDNDESTAAKLDELNFVAAL